MNKALAITLSKDALGWHEISREVRQVEDYMALKARQKAVYSGKKKSHKWCNLYRVKVERRAIRDKVEGKATIKTCLIWQDNDRLIPARYMRREK
jgi:hypothetical protein